MADPGGGNPLVLTPVFKMVFLSILGLTILSAGTGIALAIFVASPSAELRGWNETCSTAFKLGFGAIVGLIGGKAL